MSSGSKKSSAVDFSAHASEDDPEFSDPNEHNQTFSLVILENIEATPSSANFLEMAKAHLPFFYLYDIDEHLPSFYPFSEAGLANAYKLIKLGDGGRLRLMEVDCYKVLPLHAVDRSLLVPSTLTDLKLGNLEWDMLVTQVYFKEFVGYKPGISAKHILSPH